MTARAAAVASLLALMAGCGGDDEPETDRSQPPPRSEAKGRDKPATEPAPSPRSAPGADVALADCLSNAGFQDVTSAEAGLIRASDPETGSEVRVQLLGSRTEAAELAGAEERDTAVVGTAVVIYPAELDQGAKTAAEGCMSAVADEPSIDNLSAESQACADVTITPNSGDGLFEVSVSGISCGDAGAALMEWGRSRYPDPGPEGFTCSEVERYPEGNVRLRCSAGAQTIEFDTGI